MRLAYVCADPGVPVFGQKGCSVHIIQVVRALVRRGIQVDLFATCLGGKPTSELMGVGIHPLPDVRHAKTAMREKLALSANRGVAELLQREGPFDLVYERYSLWSHAPMECARAANVPGVLEVNAPLVDEESQHRDLHDRSSAERIASRVFGAASVLIAVSEEIAAYLRKVSRHSSRIHVISNGVDPDRFSPSVKPLLMCAADTFTVGFVANLRPWHGSSTLIDAFTMLHRRDPSYRLVIVGDGPERGRLEAELAAADPQLRRAVCLTGSVAPDEVPGLLASIDVAVAPYPPLPNFYFSPLKVYEYMAAGVPVVASRVGQLAHLIRDEVNGLLCPPGDASAIAAAIDRLRGDRHLRHRLAQAARNDVVNHYTWDHVVERMLDIAGLASQSPSIHVPGVT